MRHTSEATHTPDRLAQAGVKPRSRGAGVDWSSVTAENFWRISDQIQAETLRYAKTLFLYTEQADPEALRSILIQYRYFTVYYIPDLSLLIARLKNGKLRSFLADVLSDELGRGNAARAHPRLYDDFMCSIGATERELSKSALKNNIKLLNEARRKLVDPRNSEGFAVGLRGMGGECVCQVYIAQLFESLIKNPFISEHKSEIDWRFWDLHVGAHDIEHGKQTRNLINDEIVALNGNGLVELGHGYAESMKSWKAFWNNIFEATKMSPSEIERTVVESAVNVRLLN